MPARSADTTGRGQYDDELRCKNSQGVGDPEAFAFVQALAAELSKGKVDLPSFPDIALRVRRVLADEEVSQEKVVRVVGSEPALAARLMQIANSAAINFSGKPITELRTAIARMGFNMVRSAAIAFAMSQLKKVDSLKGLGSRSMSSGSAVPRSRPCRTPSRAASAASIPTPPCSQAAARHRPALHSDALQQAPRAFCEPGRVQRHRARLARTGRQGTAGEWDMAEEIIDGRERIRGLRAEHDGARTSPMC